eukprot:2856826-Karenia_brevis.AAC.1
MACTQALRQIIRHRQFGAKVNYGDCLFFAISPNEQHSALVLRLSHLRHNDPFIRHGDAQLQKIASKDAPCLEAVCGGRTQTSCLEAVCGGRT